MSPATSAMPHLVIEYSVNLEPALDPHALVRRAHEAAVATGIFPLGGVRTRAVPRTAYRVADGHPDNAFVHVLLRVGAGRDLETRRAAGRAVFDALCDHLEPLFTTRPLGVSLEVQEIDPELSFRRNTLHEAVARRGPSSPPPPGGPPRGPEAGS